MTRLTAKTDTMLYQESGGLRLFVTRQGALHKRP